MEKEMTLFLIVFTLLLPIYVLADLTPDNIYMSDSLKIHSGISSSIDVYPGQGINNLDYLTASVSFFPRNEFRQKVQSLSTSPEAQKSKNSIDFTWTNSAGNKFNYAINSSLITVNEFKEIKKKIVYPLRKDLPVEAVKFLGSTKNIDANNLAIIRKARELAEGEDDLFILVSKIGSWVKQNINYSLTTMTAEVSQPASWVLKNKIGVCDELTSLFAALLRALGVPVKFVSGLSYSNSPLTQENWGAHGWAEVYFPDVGWVPFDPTFGEFGWLDTGHIKMKESSDPVEPATKFEWRAKNLGINVNPLQFETNVISVGQKIEPVIKITANVLKNKVGFGSWNLVEANVENLKDYYVTAEVKLAKVKEFNSEDILAKQLILKPFERQKVFWRIQIATNLESKFYYFIPALIYTLRNETSRMQIISTSTSPKYSVDDLSNYLQVETKEQPKFQLVGLNCNSEKINYLVGEATTINCKIINEGSKTISQITLCAEKKCNILSLNSKETKNFNYVFYNNVIGTKEIFITAENNKFMQKNLVKYTVFDNPSIIFENITLSKEILFDQKKRIKFTLAKKSWSMPKNVVVKVEGGRMVQQVEFESLEGDVPFVFVVDGNNLNNGNNIIKMQTSFEDELRQKYFVKKEVGINLVNVTSEQKFRIWIRSAKDFLEKARLF